MIQEGYTALHYASIQGMNSVVENLLQRGADLSKLDQVSSNNTAQPSA